MGEKPHLELYDIPDGPESGYPDIVISHMREYNAIAQKVNSGGLDALDDADLSFLVTHAYEGSYVEFEAFRQILPRFLRDLTLDSIGFDEAHLFSTANEYSNRWTEEEKNAITDALLAYSRVAMGKHVGWPMYVIYLINNYAGWFSSIEPFLAIWRDEEVFKEMVGEFEESRLPASEFFGHLSHKPVSYNALLRVLLGEKTEESVVSTACTESFLTPEEQEQFVARNSALEKRIEQIQSAREKPPEDPVCGPQARRKGEQFSQAVLDWLASRQTQEGIWREGDEGHLIPTSLALLVFLGTGHTHRVGRHKECVGKALFNLAEGAGDGSFGTSDILSSSCATWAICEAYAVSREKKILEHCRRAAACLLSYQVAGAGWPATTQERESSLRETAFAVLAAKAAKVAGLNVTDESLAGAAGFFDSVTDESGRVGDDRAGSDGLPLHTAMAAICGVFCGQPRQRYKNSVNLLISCLETARSRMFEPSAAEFYFFATYALYQFGGGNWRKWLEGLFLDFLGAGASHLLDRISKETGADRPVLELPVAAAAFYEMSLRIVQQYVSSFKKWWEQD